MNLDKLAKSIKYSLHGLKVAYREEQNFRIEIIISLLVILLSILLKINTIEFVIVIYAVFGVLITELINTSIERVTNIYCNNHKTGLAKQAKDVAAAAVILSCLQAFIIGCLILLPKIFNIVF